MHSVVVTGGSRGIGLGIVRVLAASGHRVIAIARGEGSDLAQLAAQRTSGEIHFRAADLMDAGNIPALVKSLRVEFGALFGLVNNAGIGTPGVLANMPDAEIERLVRMNVLSPLLLTRHVVRSMLAAGGGRIVNVSSVAATAGYSGISAYSATKASLHGFTRSLAREVGPAGITVNVVAPGFIATEMTRGMSGAHLEKLKRRSALRRLAGVEDVAGAVAFLLSDEARNITGTVLTVDAGSTA